MRSFIFYYFGLFIIATVILMIFVKPSGYPYHPSPHPYPKSFTCDEVEEQLLKEACTRARMIIQKDEKLKEMLTGKKYKIEIGGSYPPNKPEKLRIGATIFLDKEYSFKIDEKVIKTKILLVEIDIENDRIARIEYQPN